MAVRKKQIYARTSKRARKLGVRYWRDRNGRWHDALTGRWSEGPPKHKKGDIWYQAGIQTKAPKAKKPASIRKKGKTPEQIALTVEDRFRKVFGDISSEIGSYYTVFTNADNTVDGEIYIPVPSSTDGLDINMFISELYWHIPFTFISCSVLITLPPEFDAERDKYHRERVYGQRKFIPSVKMGWFKNIPTKVPHFFLRQYELIESMIDSGKTIKEIVIRLHYSPDYKKPNNR